jgi:hypothetical protein
MAEEPVAVPEKLGIKETKEALVSLGAIAVVARKAYGAAGGDMAKFPAEIAAALMTSPEAVASLKVGFDGIKQVPAEIRDIDPFEGLELMETALKVIKDSFIAVKS